jgi:hypothetical protein
MERRPREPWRTAAKRWDTARASTWPKAPPERTVRLDVPRTGAGATRGRADGMSRFGGIPPEVRAERASPSQRPGSLSGAEARGLAPLPARVRGPPWGL